MRRLPILAIVGPTAVGKTEVAVLVAERVGGEILCADSRTVYRGMDIGTAKPSPQLRARVPHHLLDVADPHEVFTVQRFQQLAREVLVQVRARGRVPVLVGGTGLYVRAILDGLQIPPVPPDWELRRRLEEEEYRHPGVLYARLREVDPESASRIHPANLRRLIRALEIWHHLGVPPSQIRSRGPEEPSLRVGLTMDRGMLYTRIDRRIEEQLQAGFVEEVRRLLEGGVPPSAPALQALGYREIAAYLRGEVSLAEAISRWRRNTRRYARRQLIWFRADPRIQWLDVTGLPPEAVAGHLVQWVRAGVGEGVALRGS
ncbi:MAG: tRNA (adenosine(37)-N6)-dimethylallyltransferase MiaA [Armatimonadetes bacterium]|nr:tRNA (adenosine(37)-N6)-dimethylallyltransferase MiaA [Armatimonadota bacterium]MDW8153452.1 tRNA (adenosine(37)-N6)-dimethylallyltransferase MiaA [Armatimonadota bacterium]